VPPGSANVYEFQEPQSRRGIEFSVCSAFCTLTEVCSAHCTLTEVFRVFSSVVRQIPG